MISPQWLELPISQTNFHFPKAVRVIKSRLYIIEEYDRNMASWLALSGSNYPYLKQNSIFLKRFELSRLDCILLRSMIVIRFSVDNILGRFGIIEHAETVARLCSRPLRERCKHNNPLKSFVSQHKKTYLQPWASNEASNKHAHPRSLTKIFIVSCPHNESFHPWLSKLRPVKFVWLDCVNAQSDLNFAGLTSHHKNMPI